MYEDAGLFLGNTTLHRGITRDWINNHVYSVRIYSAAVVLFIDINLVVTSGAVMWRAVLFLLLIALIGSWYVLRPQGRSWSDCATPKGMICVPKAP